MTVLPLGSLSLSMNLFLQVSNTHTELVVLPIRNVFLADVVHNLVLEILLGPFLVTFPAGGPSRQDFGDNDEDHHPNEGCS